MEDQPFPLWRPLDPEAPPPEPTPWDHLPPALREWAGIYVAMSRLGFTQTEVDDMELWVIAAILDAHAGPSSDMTADDPTGEGIPMTAEDFQEQSMALIRRRIAEAEAKATVGNVDGPALTDVEAPTIP